MTMLPLSFRSSFAALLLLELFCSHMTVLAVKPLLLSLQLSLLILYSSVFKQVFQVLEEERIAFLRNAMWVYANITSLNCVKVDEVRMLLHFKKDTGVNF